ncbi:DNA alkylation repair protein [Marixanthomonas sp. SCSIO 43207]|uniref:DNA alkylation repair protein n=1 Tax=Marixanthomonas sp. SCSIO 43207 TaxID=2779360 RepID=UPI001CAA26CD|nr:DNA alkylation repair protein [Marixanthomonas sp. SCSIO 43207]UAB80821.1 DNA alkylation repair protein [Marixanthomonas sp. SCSIO 43207]
MAYKKLKYWFDKDLAMLLADKLVAIDPTFNTTSFIQNIEGQLDTLELKDRVEAFADELYHSYDTNYSNGLSKLVAILGPEIKSETGMFSTYYWIMPIAKYVEKYGLHDFTISIKAIEEITKRNTGEYAIRPYITNHKDKTLEYIKRWSTSSNFHLRRLASEGVRPRLPWAKKLDVFIENPRPIIPILNTMKDDPSRYVQKSVANCLNDILKDNFDIGKEIIEQWNHADIGKERKWIIKHALRNFIKSEDTWALSIINNKTNV